MDDIVIPAVTHDGRHADFSCWVAGTPRPQGSKSQARTGHMYEASKHLKKWRRCVSDHAFVARVKREVETMRGPLLLGAAFVLRRPDKHYRKRKSGLVLRDDAPEWHTGNAGPDLSKLIRAVEDSLTDAGVWMDDGQVSGFHSITGKRYTPRSWPRDATGVAIWVWRL